jgi:hypothetical protein
MKDYAQTGFQSACSEFSENSLSLDEYLIIKSPATKIVRIALSAPLFGINQGDLLILDLQKVARHGDLVLASSSFINGIFRLEFYRSQPMLWPGQFVMNQQDEQVVLTPILSIIKECVTFNQLDDLRDAPTYLDNKRKQKSQLEWSMIKKKNP